MFIFFLRYKLIVLIRAPQNLSRDVNDWMLEITRFFCYGCSYFATKKASFQIGITHFKYANQRTSQSPLLSVEINKVGTQYELLGLEYKNPNKFEMCMLVIYLTDKSVIFNPLLSVEINKPDADSLTKAKFKNKSINYS